jgi:CBS domain-containing protein
MALTVEDVMSGTPECLNENHSIMEAAKRFAQLEVDALPICGQDEHLKGVLTLRDVVARVLALGEDPHKTKAADLTYGDPTMVSSDTPIETAFMVMNNHNVRYLPVTDGGGRVVGMISMAEVLQVLFVLGPGVLTEGLSFGPLAGPGDSEGGGFDWPSSLRG